MHSSGDRDVLSDSVSSHTPLGNQAWDIILHQSVLRHSEQKTTKQPLSWNKDGILSPDDPNHSSLYLIAWLIVPKNVTKWRGSKESAGENKAFVLPDAMTDHILELNPNFTKSLHQGNAHGEVG